ncbi:MAG: ribosomal protein S18-alanine N-acetyltransferase [Deltaproteobacteria bacterium]|nr:ribosomal protein S18-alanine N-acetyltransferase [Deltaproteobacteria bacterium]
MHVRSLEAGDLDRVMEIEARSFTDPWTRAMIVSELGNGLSRMFVAEEDGRLQGFVIAWMVADEVHVLDLAVDPEARGLGLGRALTDAALDAGRREGAVCAVLEVRPSNHGARRLYEGMGFRVVGRRPRYYRNGEDALVMMADLDPRGEAAC